MAETGKGGWLIDGVTWSEEDARPSEKSKEPEQMTLKTVMVYWMDQDTLQKEPIGILPERRKSERENNNAIGMLRFARKVFAKTDEEAKRIVIGDFV